MQSWLEFRTFAAALRSGERGARSRTLLATIVLQWTLGMSLLAGWKTAGRDWADLGLVVPGGWRVAVGVLGILGAACLVWLQRRGIGKLSPERRRHVAERAGDTLLLLSTTTPEQRVFAATAVTAGICEELLCRGFVFWYLQHWLGPWATVVVASLPFGIAHIYQGAKGAAKTGVVALVLGSLYVASGSLLWPMIAHAGVDLGAASLGRLLGVPASRPEGTPDPETTGDGGVGALPSVVDRNGVSL